ncbi:hypothetical protein HDU98_010368 [Podochytrium sp. JEL0797]|nr:hypothetical protein HDU98_010368 [Podochytrium sp. JEL0797]
MEKGMYDDVMVTERYENRDDGKLLDWFRLARRELFYEVDGGWCKRYEYVGKGDDDAVIHVERLSGMLRGVPVGTNYVGRLSYGGWRGQHMTGMLSLVTPDLVEWIHESEIPEREKDGIEDVQLGNWLWDGNLEVTLVQKEREFHNTPNGPYFQRRIDGDSVVVHYCKHLEQFFDCCKRLYEPEVTIVTPEHFLVHPEMIRYRLRYQFGFNTTTNETIDEVYSLVYYSTREKPLTLLEYDTLLMDTLIDASLEQIGLSDIASPLRNDMIDALVQTSYDRWLMEGEASNIILQRFLRQKLKELGLPNLGDGYYLNTRASTMLTQNPKEPARDCEVVLLSDYVASRMNDFTGGSARGIAMGLIQTHANGRIELEEIDRAIDRYYAAYTQ